jgi:predicted dehydrogenase
MRVIQMGIGGMGNLWLNVLRDLDFVTYTGFVEVDQKIAEAQAAKFDLPHELIFSTLEEALTQVKADAVVSVIPPEFRIPTLETCVKYNIPLMAEKPLADSMASAQTQLEIANASGLLYIITQDYRYKPDLYTIKHILNSGALGRINAITVQHYRGLEFTGFRAEMPYPLLNDMSIHHFDLMRYFLETEPLTLYAQSWHPQWHANPGRMSAFVILNFPDDVHVSYSASWATNGLPTSYDGNWRFECEKGVLSLVDGVITINKRVGKEGWNYTYDEPEVREPLPMPYPRQAYLMWELNTALQNGGKAATTIQDNIHSLRMVFSAIESVERGEIVRF